MTVPGGLTSAGETNVEATLLSRRGRCGRRLPAAHADATEDERGRKTYTATIRLHDLRHSCASFLLASGVSPRVVMEILGHSGIAITMNTYAHALRTLLGDTIGGMDHVLGRSEPLPSALPSPDPDEPPGSKMTWTSVQVIKGGPDMAEPEPHTRGSGADRDATSRTPTPSLTGSALLTRRSAARLIRSVRGAAASYALGRAHLPRAHREFLYRPTG